MKRILVCGGRDYNNKKFVFEVLKRACFDFKKVCIIQGGAKGADTLAKEFAIEEGIPCFQCDAQWNNYQNSAGPIRNQWMVDYIDINMCLAFPGGNGTHDMVQRARNKGIETYELKDEFNDN
jgi:hypothetical protein